MEVLEENNWVWDVKVNKSGQIHNFLFVHPGLIYFSRINYHVALLDATYKNNCYKILPLQIISQEALNQLFFIEFCFLTYEDKGNYTWAVNKLKKHIWRVPQLSTQGFYN